MVGQVFDAIQATIESGKIDAGATLNLSDKSMALVVGVLRRRSQDAGRRAQEIRQAGREGAELPGHQVRRRQARRRPLPHHDHPGARGRRHLEGAGRQARRGRGHRRRRASTWPSGTDSLKLCKKLIDKSKADSQQAAAALPVERLAGADLSVRLRHAGSAGPGRHGRRAGQGRGQGPRATGRDAQVQRLTIRLEAEEGVLRLLGTAFKNAQASGALPGIGQ